MLLRPDTKSPIRLTSPASMLEVPPSMAAFHTIIRLGCAVNEAVEPAIARQCKWPHEERAKRPKQGSNVPVEDRKRKTQMEGGQHHSAEDKGANKESRMHAGLRKLRQKENAGYK